MQYKPKDNGWSCIQILEHITLTSHFLLLIIEKASNKAKQRAASIPVTQDWSRYELTTNLLTDVGVHKSFTWIRPDHMEPSGNVPLIEIRKRMMEQFDRCDLNLDLLKNGEGVLCKVTMSVNGIGKMDVYQYIYFLILHARRHISQLQENKLEFQSNTKDGQ